MHATSRSIGSWTDERVEDCRALSSPDSPGNSRTCGAVATGRMMSRATRVAVPATSGWDRASVWGHGHEHAAHVLAFDGVLARGAEVPGRKAAAHPAPGGAREARAARGLHG